MSIVNDDVKLVAVRHVQKAVTYHSMSIVNGDMKLVAMRVTDDDIA